MMHVSIAHDKRFVRLLRCVCVMQETRLWKCVTAMSKAGALDALMDASVSTLTTMSKSFPISFHSCGLAGDLSYQALTVCRACFMIMLILDTKLGYFLIIYLYFTGVNSFKSIMFTYSLPFCFYFLWQGRHCENWCCLQPSVIFCML